MAVDCTQPFLRAGGDARGSNTAGNVHPWPCIRDGTHDEEHPLWRPFAEQAMGDSLAIFPCCLILVLVALRLDSSILH